MLFNFSHAKMVFLRKHLYARRGRGVPVSTARGMSGSPSIYSSGRWARACLAVGNGYSVVCPNLSLSKQVHEILKWQDHLAKFILALECLSVWLRGAFAPNWLLPCPFVRCQWRSTRAYVARLSYRGFPARCSRRNSSVASQSRAPFTLFWLPVIFLSHWRALSFSADWPACLVRGITRPSFCTFKPCYYWLNKVGRPYLRRKKLKILLVQSVKNEKKSTSINRR